MAATPYLVTCLVTLRAEFNRLSPRRDKSSDGWIGDTAHASRTSDHNPDGAGRVLAIDIDSDGPWPVPFGALVERLRGDPRLEYIIWNRRIASRSRGWTWRTYTGSSDPHTGHAHLSARHDHTGNTSTAPWGLIQEDDVTPEDIEKIATATAAKLKPQLEQASSAWDDTFGRGESQTTAGTTLIEIRNNLRAVLAKVFEQPDSPIDEAGIVAAILAGLAPEKIAAAVAQAVPRELAEDVANELRDRLAS
ncbi:hypothetical protein [Actinoplanes siamensis]|uniref:Uncharacterized protein n=1 Tax=Actinoplanes siamensis TaxID=1223317 RepID=A0A919NCZ2_9ACTN|nr:hypothetical protein [Actinoplanes siamensis]GIF08643.1 hypothetical protein Asi03nite_61810 [Actinoplanes siamensis]